LPSPSVLVHLEPQDRVRRIDSTRP
jgi:hypothetical protein